MAEGILQLARYIVWIGFSDGLEQRRVLAEAEFRRLRVSEIALARVALHQTEPVVSRPQLTLQCRVATRISRQAIQIFHRAIYHQFAGWRSPGQILNGIVDFENERIRQLPHVVEALLGPGALRSRNAGLA